MWNRSCMPAVCCGNPPCPCCRRDQINCHCCPNYTGGLAGPPGKDGKDGKDGKKEETGFKPNPVVENEGNAIENGTLKIGIIQHKISEKVVNWF